MNDRLKLAFLGGVLLGVALWPSAAQAHISQPYGLSEMWTQQAMADGWLQPKEVIEWQEWKRNPTERWRPLVAAYFASEDVPWAMRVIRCESHGDPSARNPHSTASGLFQHLRTYWSERSGKAGWSEADIFDPEANVAVAAWLYYHGGPSHWNASRGCWR